MAAILTARGALGLAGRTDLMSPGSVAPAFRGRDRLIYSPVCLALAAGTAAGLLDRPARDDRAACRRRA